MAARGRRSLRPLDDAMESCPLAPFDYANSVPRRSGARYFIVSGPGR